MSDEQDPPDHASGPTEGAQMRGEDHGADFENDGHRRNHGWCAPVGVGSTKMVRAPGPTKESLLGLIKLTRTGDGAAEKCLHRELSLVSKPIIAKQIGPDQPDAEDILMQVKWAFHRFWINGVRWNLYIGLSEPADYKFSSITVAEARERLDRELIILERDGEVLRWLCKITWNLARRIGRTLRAGHARVTELDDDRPSLDHPMTAIEPWLLEKCPQFHAAVKLDFHEHFDVTLSLAFICEVFCELKSPRKRCMLAGLTVLDDDALRGVHELFKKGTPKPNAKKPMTPEQRKDNVIEQAISRGIHARARALCAEGQLTAVLNRAEGRAGEPDLARKFPDADFTAKEQVMIASHALGVIAQDIATVFGLEVKDVEEVIKRAFLVVKGAGRNGGKS